MPVDTSYLFRGLNIGSTSIFDDSINVPEFLSLLSKKFFGYVNTVPDNFYYSEDVPSFQYSTPNGFPYLHQNKLNSQVIPLSNPLVDTSRFSAITTTYSLKLEAMSKDPTFSNYNYFYFNKNMKNDSLSSKYISKDYPYIAFYSNLLLTNISINERSSTSLYKNNFDITYVHPLLQNAISINYDYSYSYNLYQSDGTTIITPFNGSWLVDTDVGAVSFYDRTVPQVGSNNLPRISFFRYEGLIGEASILQGQDL